MFFKAKDSIRVFRMYLEFRRVLFRSKSDLTTEQKKYLFENSKGKSYREILNDFNQVVNGGTIVTFTEGISANYWKLCEAICKGEFQKAVNMIESDEKISAANERISCGVASSIFLPWRSNASIKAGRVIVRFIV